MALPRFFRLSAERRHRIIAAAAMEFADKGYVGALLEAIADNVGIGKSSFYYYFTDKADLCHTVLDEAWNRLTARGRIDLATLTPESYWTKFEEIVRQNLEACADEPWLVNAAKFLNRSLLDSSGEAVLEDYHERRREWEEAWIARGQELGVVRGDMPTELLAVISLNARQAANVWMLDRMDEIGLEATNHLALRLMEIQRAMLIPPPSCRES